VRELPSSCASPSTQFADDNTVYDSDKSPDIVLSKLSNSFACIKQFCDAHELTINAAKTQLILFKAPGKKLPQDLSITLDNCVICPSSSVKLLGVTIDERLTFSQDIDNIVRKCHGLLGVLSRAAAMLPTELLKLAYVSLIRSQLEYASAVRASVAPSQLRRLDVIQKMGSRIISHAPRNAHSAPLQKALGLESLEARRTTHIIDLVSSMMSVNCHPALKDLIRWSDEGCAESDATARIGLGRRRLAIFARDLYNSHRPVQTGCPHDSQVEGLKTGRPTVPSSQHISLPQISFPPPRPTARMPLP
jgi:hypothetical protein